MEWMCHEVRNRVNTADWSQPPQRAEGTSLALELLPVTRRLGDFELTGFSYQYHYESPDIPVYKLFDRGTWEIDGKAAGNTMWVAQGHASAIHPFTDAGHGAGVPEGAGADPTGDNHKGMIPNRPPSTSSATCP